MKTKYPSVVGLLVAVLIGLSFQLFAQEKRATPGPAAAPQKDISAADKLEPRASAPQNKISAADKAAIMAMFKGVDPSKYRLEFDGGKQTMGSKKVSMAEIRQVSKVENPGNEAARVVFIAKDRGVMICLKSTVNRKVLEGALGSEKVARLNQILAKYPQ
jgi:hypothetical protein